MHQWFRQSRRGPATVRGAALHDVTGGNSGKAQSGDEPSQENCLLIGHRWYPRWMGRGLWAEAQTFLFSWKQHRRREERRLFVACKEAGRLFSWGRKVFFRDALQESARP